MPVPPPPPPLLIRPRRVRHAAFGIAAAITTVFTVSALTLTGTTTVGGQLFPHDSWALAALGIVFGALALIPLRIRADADARGVRVHNLVGDIDVPWTIVRAVRYQRGTPWASLELSTDEVIAVLAVQITDRQRAVDAIRALRALHAAAHAPVTEKA